MFVTVSLSVFVFVLTFVFWLKRAMQVVGFWWHGTCRGSMEGWNVHIAVSDSTLCYLRKEQGERPWSSTEKIGCRDIEITCCPRATSLGVDDSPSQIAAFLASGRRLAGARLFFCSAERSVQDANYGKRLLVPKIQEIWDKINQNLRLSGAGVPCPGVVRPILDTINPVTAVWDCSGLHLNEEGAKNLLDGHFNEIRDEPFAWAGPAILVYDFWNYGSRQLKDRGNDIVAFYVHFAQSVWFGEQFPFSFFPTLRDAKHVIPDLSMPPDYLWVCDVCRRGAPDEDMIGVVFVTPGKGTCLDWWYCGHTECKKVIDGLSNNGFYKRSNRTHQLLALPSCASLAY